MNFSQEQFEKVFHSRERVQGLTHDFYKYPARFNPQFVRFILERFSAPGDWVLDPFMGGGTTIVESLASGRRVAGSDINELADFVTRVKTTPLSNQDISEVLTWVETVKKVTPQTCSGESDSKTSVRNMPSELVPHFEIAINLVGGLTFPRRRSFARCALVRVGQWALDSRTFTPSVSDCWDELEKRVQLMVRGLNDLVMSARKIGVKKNKITGLRHLRNHPAASRRMTDSLKRRGIRPKLILTSPPYPGVHVLYHRWQVWGRRETPAPYWITNLRDGHGESYYTMGGRSALGQKSYFEELQKSFANLRTVLHKDANVVQLISFSNTDTQLPLYLEAMESAGFREANSGNIESGQFRDVPNRKWYNSLRRHNDASRELLLVHQLKG